MSDRKYKLHDGRKGAALAVRVTPKAGRNEIIGALNDGTIKIHLATRPGEGDANEELVRYLAQVLDVPRKNVEIVAGISGQDKLVSVLDIDTDSVNRKISEIIQ